MRWLPILAVLLAGPAWADPTALQQLAPTQQELEEALDSAEAASARAQALAEATLLLQNALAPHRAVHRDLPVCEDPAITSLVARVRWFGRAWRDTSQRLRVESDRLERMAIRGTARVDPGRVARVAEAAQANAEALALASAWQGTWIETAFDECSPELADEPGLAEPARAAGEERGSVAVFLRGGGFLCPGLVPADGRVVVAPSSGCLSRSACECVPAPLLPGAVLTTPQSAD